jgi:hypothetical protein
MTAYVTSRLGRNGYWEEQMDIQSYFESAAGRRCLAEPALDYITSWAQQLIYIISSVVL